MTPKKAYDATHFWRFFVTQSRLKQLVNWLHSFQISFWKLRDYISDNFLTNKDIGEEDRSEAVDLKHRIISTFLH